MPIFTEPIEDVDYIDDFVPYKNARQDEFDWGLTKVCVFFLFLKMIFDSWLMSKYFYCCLFSERFVEQLKEHHYFTIFGEIADVHFGWRRWHRDQYCPRIGLGVAKCTVEYPNQRALWQNFRIIAGRFQDARNI